MTIPVIKPAAHNPNESLSQTHAKHMVSSREATQAANAKAAKNTKMPGGVLPGDSTAAGGAAKKY